jgi:hypothetical protein
MLLLLPGVLGHKAAARGCGLDPIGCVLRCRIFSCCKARVGLSSPAAVIVGAQLSLVGARVCMLRMRSTALCFAG